MALEFRPTIKSINIASEELTKITLEVKNGSLDGKYDDLRRFSGKTVNITIVPEYYRYVIPYDKSTNAATVNYIVNNDGTVELKKEEQTQLDLDQKGNIDIEMIEFMVEKEVVDEFILEAHSLEFPSSVNVNPRDVLARINQGESLSEIADDYEIAEVSVLSELEKAREYYAPYAAAWAEKKEREGFVFDRSQKPAGDTKTAENDTETVGGSTEVSETDNKTAENDTTPADETNSDDPY